tara:strand:+ start:3520 stop:3780 length:261 start_codon:yes stop_codon:yes gene_type:complete
MKKLFTALALLLSSCASPNKSADTLHNYPVIDPSKCPVPLERYDEEFLRARARSLNIRYVDYLHALTNGKIEYLRQKELNANLGAK